MIYLVTIGIVVLVMVVWIMVQNATQRFSREHPEFGPPSEMGQSCCGKCGSHGCDKEQAQ